MTRTYSAFGSPARILYLSSGAAHIIGAHRAWLSGIDDPTQVSVTFSSQVAQFVEDIGAEALMMSFGRDAEVFREGRFTLEHAPSPARGGIGWYREEYVKASRALARARRFGADLALVDSGALSYFTLPLFRAARIRVVPILHNVLWPAGHPPAGRAAKAKAMLDAPFWRFTRDPVLAVSREGMRQADAVRRIGSPGAISFNPLFRRRYFDDMPPTPVAAEPFNVMFVGRAARDKGVLMLPDIAAIVEARVRGGVRYTVCGDGPDLPALRNAVEERGLARLFDIRGWTAPSAMPAIYAGVHAVVVPTTSGFREGLAMTAIEAVLAGRPIVTNPVVPALEYLGPAALAARPDDAASHAERIVELVRDPALYARLCAATRGLGEQFFDERNGLRMALHRAMGTGDPAHPGD